MVKIEEDPGKELVRNCKVIGEEFMEETMGLE